MIGEVEARILATAWEHTGGNQVQMAELLGMSRMTLRTKLRAAGLLREKPGTDD